MIFVIEEEQRCRSSIYGPMLRMGLVRAKDSVVNIASCPAVISPVMMKKPPTNTVIAEMSTAVPSMNGNTVSQVLLMSRLTLRNASFFS